MTRKPRSTTSQETTADSTNPVSMAGSADPAHQGTIPSTAIKIIPTGQRNFPGLTTEETGLLRKKQYRLRLAKAPLARTAAAYGKHITTALQATYIFAQHEAGTAACIDPHGWILTCSHCFGESEREWRENMYKWLLDYTGKSVQVECCFWDGRRDLALARVVSVETDEVDMGAFEFIPLHSSTSAGVYGRADIVCLGQPGSEDLESESPQATDYDLIEISEGRLRGLVPDADPHDNSEIGSLKHDAWTYWGHSGAPLVCGRTGKLLGLHSSWDDMTAMRHGVPLVAIRAFLGSHLPGFEAAGSDANVDIIIID
ncbi:hypothetical protein ASPVEDRAFT_45272 [Aspergillus versicolor CBS 583.65]|uniref:AT hook domain-containing protein family protein n=1 Tax=Aspergillus versicolor CBS 583.65 TaxID=1036611 RepID=A0A1L9PW58_ASPVE|nr:uncharacterized protein ASPVEDRAFT_45272 [Aspergillus versicolor CBS 583.65]OJJ05779.1 hypothetical protein ASPVEDRAFT_45272 [Aspergillus versicolor CBS 583.65]